MYEEIVLDECALQEIRLRLEEKAQTALALSGLVRMPAHKVLRHLADLRRMGHAVLGATATGEPLWSAARGSMGHREPSGSGTPPGAGGASG
jgi:hypothetical protein